MPAPPTDEEMAEAIKRDCMSRDFEADHSKADDMLIELLKKLDYIKTAEAWDDVGKWYS